MSVKKKSSQELDISKVMNKILINLFNHKESEPFRTPVDYKNLGLYDYPTIVKTPMDLSKIKRNLKSSKYKSLKEFVSDVELIWSNCRLYNYEGSLIYDLANRMDSYFKSLISEYLPSESRKLSLRDKTESLKRGFFNEAYSTSEIENSQAETRNLKDILTIARKAKKLNNEQLAIFATIIKENDPECFTEKGASSYRIFIERIQQETISKIFNFFDSLELELNGTN